MLILQTITLLILLILLIIIGSYMIHSWLFSVPFYPARSAVFERIIKQLGIETKGKRFIDIGSGDGRIVIKAAKLGMKADGVEINPFLTLWSRFKIHILFLSRDKASSCAKASEDKCLVPTIINKSWSDIDYSDYDIVYMYIYNEHMDKLKDKLFRELKKGSIIVSNVFSFSDIKEDERIDNYRIYRV